MTFSIYGKSSRISIKTLNGVKTHWRWEFLKDPVPTSGEHIAYLQTVVIFLLRICFDG
jgi:hypothetical protein